MSSDVPRDNVVSRARAKSRPKRLVSRRVARGALLVAGIIAVGGVIFAPTPFIRGISLTSLLCVAIGAGFSWLSGSGAQLSESGKEMGEDWMNQWNAPPPP